MRYCEKYFSDQVRDALRKMDIFAFRVETSHTCPGHPDWVLWLPGRIVYMELKVDGGRLTKAQRILHQTMQGLGLELYVLTKTQYGVMVNDEEPVPLVEALRNVVER